MTIMMMPDSSDNCPCINNADQADSDEDGIGDACDTGCIATMLLGEGDPRLDAIRRFRDEISAKSTTGRALIKLYYTYADNMIEICERKPVIIKSVKIILKSLIPAMELMLKK